MQAISESNHSLIDGAFSAKYAAVQQANLNQSDDYKFSASSPIG
jgi:hypothetical protein